MVVSQIGSDIDGEARGLVPISSILLMALLLLGADGDINGRTAVTRIYKNINGTE